MPFGLYNAPATFQWLMKNCLGELNLIYCLIYLDDIIIFSQTAEEDLHHLCIIFDQFREHNLKMKPSKCDFFGEEITYLAHWVWKDGVWPSNSNLKAITEWATTEGPSKGLHTLHSHSVNIWLEKEPAGSQSRCCFQKMPWRLSKHWNRHVWQLPFWLLLTTPNCSCCRLMCPRMDWGQCYCRRRQMADATLLSMAVEPLFLMRRIITQLSLKWTVTEHFKDYLLY